jgi:hypothetical protein
MSKAISVVLLGLVASAGMGSQMHNYVPKNGYVPDEKTAVAVAQAVLTPIYGEAKLAQEKPFHAVLDDKDVWTVEGSLPAGQVGGVAMVRLSRRDGHILSVTHGK